MPWCASPFIAKVCFLSWFYEGLLLVKLTLRLNKSAAINNPTATPAVMPAYELASIPKLSPK